MALDPTPVPAFPAVDPLAPGVPPVTTPVGTVQPVLGVFADAIINQLVAPQVWGYYKDGEPLLPVTVSVVEVEFRRDEVISQAPQEEGAFMDYNKVSNPFTAKVRYALAGAQVDRGDWLNIILEAEESLDLYDLVQPEVTYPDVSITRHDFQRTARNGISMILVDVYCEEVRKVDGTGFAGGQTAAAADPVNNGPQQPAAPTPAQADTVTPDNADVLPAGAIT